MHGHGTESYPSLPTLGASLRQRGGAKKTGSESDAGPRENITIGLDRRSHPDEADIGTLAHARRTGVGPHHIPQRTPRTTTQAGREVVAVDHAAAASRALEVGPDKDVRLRSQSPRT